MKSRKFQKLISTTIFRYIIGISGVTICGSSMALICPAVSPSIPVRQLYVIAGQSNAAGVASVDDYTSGPKDFVQATTNYPNVKIYGIYGYNAYLNGKDDGKESRDYNVNWPSYASWNTAKPGFGYKNVSTPTEAEKRFGPEVFFASLLNNQPPYDHYIVKLAVSDTPLANHAYKDNWSPSGRLYGQLLTMIENAYNSKKTTVKLRVAGLFFMQGESDALDSTSAANYKSNLSTFITNFRSSVYSSGCTDDPNVPVVIGRIQDNTTWTYRKEVRLAQQEIDKNSASIGLANTDDFNTELLADGFHYNEYGQAHLGARMYFSLFVPHPEGEFQFPIQKKSSSSTVIEQFYTQGVMGGAYCCKTNSLSGSVMMNYLPTQNTSHGVCSGYVCTSEYGISW